MTSRLVKRLLMSTGLAVTVLTAIVSARTALSGAYVPPAGEALEAAIPSGAAERLAGAVRIGTISHADGATDLASFHRLHAFLESSFPRVHATLSRETVNRGSLLFRWRGTDSSLKPILLMGHLDVVPVEPATESNWQHDPFGGAIVDGFIWGRGSIDNKSGVLGTLEAVETLLAEGFTPERTIYLAYGHDEER